MSDTQARRSKVLVPVLVAAGLVVLLVILLVLVPGLSPKPEVQPQTAKTEVPATPAPAKEPAPPSPAPSPLASEWTIERLQETIKANTPLYFYKDSARLLPGELKKVEAIVAVMQHYDNVMLHFRGHTALFGSEPVRISLSRRRANRVRWAFEYREGYNITAVTLEALGASELLSRGKSEAAMAPNRRVEVILKHAEVKDSAR